MRPNHLQDILHNTEQLTFYLPDVVEKLLSLYEEVYNKYIKEQVDSGLSFERLAHQWIQQIYIILSNNYKEIKNNEKASFYYKKISDYGFNEKERLEFSIKHYQYKIGYKIMDNDFNNIKPIFNKLNEIYIVYEEKFNECHPSYMNWLIFEDLIYLCYWSDTEYQRAYRILRNDILKNKDKISEGIFNLFNTIGLIKGKEFDVKNNIGYSEYSELKIYVLKHINAVLEKALEIQSPLLIKKIEKTTKIQENNLISEFEQFQKSFRSNNILILGQDTTERDRLTSIKKCLAQMGYEGIIIKELRDETEVQSIEHKVSLYAHICRFVIVENSTVSGHIDELKICEINKIITVILQQEGYGATYMQEDYSYEHRYIEKFLYSNNEKICEVIRKAVEWANIFIEERKSNYQNMYPWREFN